MKLLKRPRSTVTARAVWNDTVLAESTDAVLLEGNHYFPPHDVNWELLEPSPTQTVCPWKGEARYYTVVVDGQRNEDAAWRYPEPKPAARAVHDHVAFWHGVEIEPVERAR